MTGVPPGSQRLRVKVPGRPEVWADDDERLIGSYGLVKGVEIEVSFRCFFSLCFLAFFGCERVGVVACCFLGDVVCQCLGFVHSWTLRLRGC